MTGACSYKLPVTASRSAARAAGRRGAEAERGGAGGRGEAAVGMGNLPGGAEGGFAKGAGPPRRLDVQVTRGGERERLLIGERAGRNLGLRGRERARGGDGRKREARANAGSHERGPMLVDGTARVIALSSHARTSLDVRPRFLAGQ